MGCCEVRLRRKGKVEEVKWNGKSKEFGWEGVAI